MTDEDRVVIDEIRSKGVHTSREINRAHVLSCLDRGLPKAQIMAVLGMGRTAVWRTRAAYLQGGLDLAVFDVARPGRPRQYDTDAEARVTALACSAPPEGRQRWTMQDPICGGRAMHARGSPYRHADGRGGRVSQDGAGGMGEASSGTRHGGRIRWAGMFPGCHRRRLHTCSHPDRRRRARSGTPHLLVGQYDVGQRQERDAWHLRMRCVPSTCNAISPSSAIGSIAASIWLPWSRASSSPPLGPRH